MNRDDDTFLSAYLDGELDLAERTAVEAALLSDRRLAERLRELAAVRSLIAGLPRPAAPRDLSGEIARRIGSRRPNQFTLVGTRDLSRARVRAAGLATAATVLLTLTVGVLSYRSRPPEQQRFVETVAAPHSAPQPHGAAIPAVPVKAPVLASAATAIVEPVKAPLRRMPTSSADDQGRLADVAQFRAMLDSPNLRKVFVVIDEIGGDADRRITRMLDHTPRINSRYGRTAITHGIVIDPDHPDKATVFAVALTGQELDQFRGELSRNFARSVEETDADPAVVTQLADVGRTAIFPGTAVASLEPPAESPARLARQEGTEVVIPEESEEPVLTPERKNSGPAPFNGRIATAPAHQEDMTEEPLVIPESPEHTAAKVTTASARRTENRREETVVLVWVTTRPSRGLGP